jgi:glycerol uptake facilitator-like aquaporin
LVAEGLGTALLLATVVGSGIMAERTSRRPTGLPHRPASPTPL